MTLPDDLTSVETQVVADVRAGRIADVSKGVPDVAVDALPTVRAAVIAALCVPDGPASYKRVAIRGARITGQLNLEEQELACSLRVTRSVFDSEIVLTSASCRTVCLDGSVVPGIQADWSTVRGNILLRDGFEATGEVRFLGATISATLNCRGGRIQKNATGRALTAGLMKATAVLLGERFEAYGTVAFPAADIAGNVNADASVFHAPGGVALNLERIKTGGYVFARAREAGRTVIEGTLRLYRAEIGANVELDGALILAVEASAIEATGLSAKGAVFLRHGFEVYGETRLESASVGTGLDCAGGRFRNPGGDALAAPGVSIGQKIRLTSAAARYGAAKCQAAGRLNLERATVGSDIVADGLTLSNPGRPALTLRGARIEGDLYLRDATVAGELQLLGANVTGRVNLVGTTIDNPTGMCVGASGLHTGGSVWFGDRDSDDNRRFTGTGGVQLSRAEIGADLFCHGALFDGRTMPACRLWGASVHGDVYFVDGFHAIGELRMMDVRIGGSLVMDGATLSNPSGVALQAERARIGGAVTMRASEASSVSWLFVAFGSVRFHSASMLALVCERATISNPGSKALDAYGMTVATDVVLRNHFRLDGSIVATSAKIGGRFFIDTAKLAKPTLDGESLVADRVAVGLGLQLREAEVAGRVGLFSATLGSLECLNSTFSSEEYPAFDATAMTVSGSLVIRQSTWAGGVKLLGARISGAFELGQSSFAGGLNLRHAHVAILSDDASSWPESRLFLDGFAYDLLGSSAVTSAPQRIAWLRRQGDGEYRPQVYEQLARVLRQMGLDSDAREIAIAKRDAALSRGWRRIWRWPLKVTIGHGYKPWRAFWCLVAMAVLGWAVFEYAGRHGGMTTIPGAAPGVERTFAFQPVVYAIDTLLPVVDLQQEKNWFPNLWSPLGPAVRTYLWVHIAIGWVLVTLLLGAMSGLIKRE